MAGSGDLHTSNKPYLRGTAGALAGVEFNIEFGRAVVGRDAAQCDLVLPQAYISRRHALLEVEGNGRVVITSLTDKPATFVNGEPVTRRVLRDGDVVGFGPGGIISLSFHASRLAQSRAPSVAAYQSPVAAPPAPAAPTVFPQPREVAPTVFPQGRTATTVLRAFDGPVLRVGRAPDNDIVLEAPGVSRHHAILTYNGQAQPVITDLDSTNGTFVNGELLTEARRLAPSDLIFLGGFLLHVNGREIRKHDLSASRITAQKISKTIGGRPILKEISLAIYPREFVGLMGPSGCGKSTLMDTLNGLRPATTGSVQVNDLDLYKNFDALRLSIGYVPQRDILHDALSVERTLYYAARLRLPEGTSQAEVQHAVDEVIHTVGLGEHRTTAFRQLSGGQQKRLSLALELITKPTFIFLDEPTSPLDPETTENMMLLFRKLADEGRIVVMVTHKFEKFYEMHHIAMLTRGGRLAFFGPPREALAYFGCTEPGDIYRAIGARDPEELSGAFKASPHYQKYVASRIAENQALAHSSGSLQFSAAAEQAGPERRVGLKQWLTLTRRYLEVKLKDRRNTFLLLLQAPVVAVLLALITRDTVNDAKALFIAAIVSIWFGANNAIREVVSESPIYTRERLGNLKIPSYVMSKYAVLSGLGLIQCLLFVGILVGFGRFRGADFLPLGLVLYLTLLAGMAAGLFFSALVSSTEKAMSVLPLILIPQLLLSGFLQPLDNIYVNQRGEAVTVADYERYEEAKDDPPQSGTAPPAPVRKYDGLGAARFASSVIIARWSIEALAHQVGVRDEKARDKLPTQMSVAEYARVLDGESESDIREAYGRRVRLDLAALAVFNAVFLALTMLALKRKDVL